MEPINIPNEFILIIDKDGDAIDVSSRNSTIDSIFSNLRYLDKTYPQYAPHSAWKYDGDDFILVEDVCHLK